MIRRQTILLIALLIVGCDNSTEPNSDTYSVSDLEGVWMGSVTSTGSALPDGTIIDGGYEFDSQGNLVDWIGGPGVLSTNGNLDISGIGDITGTTTTIHINGNNAEESTVCNWQGSQLVSINTIEVNMQCDWTTNDGSSGSYNFSGSMDKSTEPQDCAGVAGGIAALDNCGNCIDGGVGADGWNDCDFEATIDDYIGTWVGIGVFNAELEDDSGSHEATLILQLSGENMLSGTVDNGYESNNISGSVSGSIFTFIFLNNAPDSPDCINWDVSGSASLESQTKMNLECSGTFCGSGGGQQASYSGTLTKQS